MLLLKDRKYIKDDEQGVIYELTKKQHTRAMEILSLRRRCSVYRAVVLAKQDKMIDVNDYKFIGYIFFGGPDRLKLQFRSLEHRDRLLKKKPKWSKNPKIEYYEHCKAIVLAERLKTQKKQKHEV